MGRRRRSRPRPSRGLRQRPSFATRPSAIQVEGAPLIRRGSGGGGGPKRRHHGSVASFQATGADESAPRCKTSAPCAVSRSSDGSQVPTAHSPAQPRSASPFFSETPSAKGTCCIQGPQSASKAAAAIWRARGRAAALPFAASPRAQIDRARKLRRGPSRRACLSVASMACGCPNPLGLALCVVSRRRRRGNGSESVLRCLCRPAAGSALQISRDLCVLCGSKS